MGQRRTVRRPFAVTTTGVVLLLLLAGGPLAASPEPAGPTTTDELVERLHNAWFADRKSVG